MSEAQNNAPAIIKYYHTVGSRLGYRLLLGGNKHFGYYPDQKNSISMRQAMVNMQEQLAQALALDKGSRVLDAGCGMGDTAFYLVRRYQLDVVGIDLLNFNIEQANNKKQPGDTIEFEIQNYGQTSFESASFDAIYTMETLVHAADYHKVLKEFYRLLKPGGRIVMFEYSRAPDDQLDAKTASIFKTINKYAAMPSFQAFYHGVLKKGLEDTGFKVKSVKDISLYMKPMVRRFWQIALVPYQVVRLLHLEKYFINTMSGYEIYVHFENFRYNIFVADKPK